MRRRMSDKQLLFSCDSANESMHHVINVSYFWYLDRVLTFLLDLDACVRDNKNTAEAADVSLKKLDRYNGDSIIKVMLNVLCVDASRGEKSQSCCRDA